MNSVTSGGTYTTSYATPDQSKASCWSNGPNNNVWFTFTAVTAGINVGVIVNGAGETMQNPFVAIYDASLNPLTCQNYQGAKTNLSLTYTALTPGNTYYIVVDNYAGYAGSFDLAVYNNMVILPLQLVSFGARAAAPKQVDIYWSIGLEENISTFVVQRSNGLSDFNDIGQVTPVDNGTTQVDYSFVDKAPLAGEAYYRLKVADNTGDVSYSKTAGVNFSGAMPISITLFPNPSNENQTTWLKIDNGNGIAAIVVTVYDMLGRAIYCKLANLSGLSPYLLQIQPGQHLAAGIYNVTIVNAGSGDLLYRQQLCIK